MSFLSLLLEQGLDSWLFVGALDAAQSQLQCLPLPSWPVPKELGTQRGQGLATLAAGMAERHLSTALAAELFPGLRDQPQLVTQKLPMGLP